MVDSDPTPPDISCSLRLDPLHHRHQDVRHSHGDVRNNALKSSRTKTSYTSLILVVVFILFAFIAPQPANASVLPAQHRDASTLSAASLFNTEGWTNNAGAVIASSGERADERDRIITLLRERMQPPTTTGQDASASRTITRRAESSPAYTCRCGKEPLSQGAKVGYGIVVPILVILSGIFAGLTLGYMSLDETQLQVLATTGSEQQQAYARKIIPIRKDGHLLLTTLLIANMITNETLPIVSDPLFPSPVLAVVVSTVLVIIFAELVPQSVCSRYGLEIGAYMAIPTRIVIICLWPIAFPVSRILHWTLGPHHGIVYRRAELKELVTMHAASGGRGGDLVGDTVMMVGGALDLQEKVVEQAMTPIDKVFMLPFDAKLDYPTLQRIVRSGHSRIPIYHEVEVEVSSATSGANTPSKRGKNFFNALARRNTSSASNEKLGVPGSASPNKGDVKDAATPTTIKRKNIIGTLLVKSCVLLDPEDAVPVSDMTINALPTVPSDEPLHNVLNAFQEGRSHMAIVTSTARTDGNVALDPGSSSSLLVKKSNKLNKPALKDIDEEAQLETGGRANSSASTTAGSDSGADEPNKLRTFWKKHFSHDDNAEQTVPSDAEVNEKAPAGEKTFIPADAAQRSRSTRGDILGIITLEDVLEELIGEEIYDEYDPHEGVDGENAWNNVSPPSSPGDAFAKQTGGAAASDDAAAGDGDLKLPPAAVGVTEESSEQQQQQHVSFDQQQPAAQPQPAKTLLNRLGLTGRPKGSAGSNSNSTGTGGTSSPAPQAAAATTGSLDVAALSTNKAPTTSPVPMSPTEGTATTFEKEDTADGDYFGQPRADSADQAVAPTAPAPATQQQQQRSTSLGPAPSRSGTTPGLGISGGTYYFAPSSRPTTPGIAPTPGVTASSQPLASPQPNRPIVLRKTMPGGGTQNVIVGENMLRGRPANAATALMASQGQGQAQQQASAAGGLVVVDSSGQQMGVASAGGSTSRSSTPKPSRFKSTPLAQHGGNATADQSAGAAAVARVRSRSQSVEPRSASGGGPATAAPAISASEGEPADKAEDGVGNGEEQGANEQY